MTPSQTSLQQSKAAISLVSCMRNEGANLLEWIAYHQTIGFDQIIVVSNNCTDGSDALLDHLHDLGEVIHIPNDPDPSLKPQFEGLRVAAQAPEVQASDWVMVLDADEYMCVTIGDGRVNDLIDHLDTDTDVIPLSWRHFGCAGYESWKGEFILETRTKTHEVQFKPIVGHKSMFRPQKFERFHPHMPKEPKSEVTVRSTIGRKLPSRALKEPQWARYKGGFDTFTFENAYVAHHALKAPEVVRTKRYRGFGGTPIDGRFDLDGDFFQQRNRNEVDSRDLLKHWPEVQMRMSTLLEDVRTKELHTKTQTWMIEEIARVIELETSDNPNNA